MLVINYKLNIMKNNLNPIIILVFNTEKKIKVQVLIFIINHLIISKKHSNYKYGIDTTNDDS